MVLISKAVICQELQKINNKVKKVLNFISDLVTPEAEMRLAA